MFKNRHRCCRTFPPYCDLGCRRSARRHGYRSEYTGKSFAFDLTMTACTGGLWLGWVFCREVFNALRGR